MHFHAPRPMKMRRHCGMLAGPRRCTVVGDTLVRHARKERLTRASIQHHHLSPPLGEHAEETCPWS
jgi:hypothetical protein